MYKLAEFESLQKELQGVENDLLCAKRREYAGNVNVIDNFEQTAAFFRTSPEHQVMQLLVKHIQGINNTINNNRVAWAIRTQDGQEGLIQRIMDARNYLLLLAACLDVKHGASRGEIESYQSPMKAD